MRIRAILIFSLCIFGLLLSRNGSLVAQVLYRQGFTSSGWPSELIRLDLDHLTPTENNYGATWNIYQNLYGEYEAASTTRFTPAGSVNDWMILPQVTVAAIGKTYLYYQVRKYADSGVEHKLFIKVSTTGVDPANFTTVVHTDGIFDSQIHQIQVDLSAFAGQSINLAFVHAETSDDYYLYVDEISVVAENLNFPDIELSKYYLDNQYLLPGTYPLSLIIKNTGATVINDITVNWTDQGSNHGSKLISGLSLAYKDVYPFLPGISMAWPTAGVYPLKVWLSAPNGKEDADGNNNTLEKNFTVLPQTAVKRVLIEEFSGTWCGYCPMGPITLRNIVAKYPGKVIGASYHYTDGMSFSEGWDFIKWLYVYTYPSAAVNRTLLFNYGKDVAQNIGYWDSSVSRQLNIPSPADITGTVSYNTGTRVATVIVNVDFRALDKGNFRINAVLTEDGVTGYPQKNYYNNDPAYPELKNAGDPIANYVHNHVARLFADGTIGTAGVIPQSVKSGDHFSKTYSIQVPSGVKPENAHVVIYVCKDGGPYDDRQVLNVNQYSLVPGPGVLAIKVFLEGAFNPVSGSMNTTLNSSPQTLPLTQPFNGLPWYYTGAETVASIPAGVVDWVLVELRDAVSAASATPSTKLAGWPKAFFLKSDGSIVDLDGTSPPAIGNQTAANNLYVIIRHRSHLAIMSATGASYSSSGYTYDFTTGLTQAFGGAIGYKMAGSKAVMVAGDINHDGNIYVSDYNSWAAGFGATSGYFNMDLDMDRNVSVSDYNKWAANYGLTVDSKIKSAQIKPKYFSCVPGR